MELNQLKTSAIDLLKSMIQTESFSEQEQGTALLIENWLQSYGVETQRDYFNIWATNKHFDDTKPTILMNSHHDTVRPNKAYTRDPFQASVEDGKLYGLGSNDAGGCLVSLLATFVSLYEEQDLKYNLLMIASAEEEAARDHGLASVIPVVPSIDFAIVGEPTLLNLAIAEKGLLVLDCYVDGTPGHAAHIKEDMAIYKAMEDIKWFEEYKFEKVSEVLGPVKMTVTQINAGTQHNVVPAKCHYVVDVRVNDKYTNKEILDFISSKVHAKVQARSLRLNSSAIDKNHPIVQAGVAMGRETYGSPTLSDQAVLTCQSLKLGPGDSLRSHSADEFIYLHEIEEGIDLYRALIKKIN
ncbi:MAG: M20 family metallo-hydrolase [Flavobacteriaceae bacterium]